MDFCYCQPQFSNDDSYKTSFIDATAMRHPMIERIQTNIGYVPNDVCLGAKPAKPEAKQAKPEPEETGWLLFGINASGKSSLMKAIGLNVLMAQAGMFVPCQRFEYEPYHAIFTRISGADNIYRGMSSFTVEMTELRNILLRCNEYSLVLGDELCAGTEALSALSIVAAGIQTLVEKRACFVFATHLHELMRMNAVPSSVGVYHIHIKLDEATQTIVYDRHLTRGSGHAYYGLEVCKALGLPSDFLKIAHQHRRMLQEEPTSFLNVKPSNYNKSIYMDKCAVCSAPATETHHIQYQRDAKKTNSKKKHVDHIPLHSPANLIPLCEGCHKKEHQGLLKIDGYTMTSEGRRLSVASSAS